MAVLVGTVGATWAIVPEMFGALSRHSNLFEHYPDPDLLRKLRNACGLTASDDLEALWLIASDGVLSKASIDKVLQWWDRLGAPGELRVWVACGSGEVARMQEIERVRELIYRVVLHAHARFNGNVLLSLAGGRKTMSADMQAAAAFFGCRGLFHVVGPDRLPEAMRNDDPTFWTAPLDGALAGQILPALVDNYPRSDLADLDGQAIGVQGLTVEAYPLPHVATGCGPETIEFAPSDDEARLIDNVEARRKQSHGLLCGFLQSVSRDEKRENWRSLYRCPPRIINLLRTLKAPEGRELIERLPKADIHCHVGGVLDTAAQKRVGERLWAQLSNLEKRRAQRVAVPLMEEREWGPDWPERLKSVAGHELSAAAACLLKTLSGPELEHRLFAATLPRRGLKANHPSGFRAYELPGDLSGSTLLRDRRAVGAYAEEIVRYGLANRLAYLELRGSPDKYQSSRTGEWLVAFERALDEAKLRLGSCIQISFIAIVNRRAPESAGETIRTALNLRNAAPDFLLGIDVAGDEGAAAPEAFVDAFRPVFEACLPVTIHAGEGEEVDRIWSAAYQLNADRVGHGLTLAAKPELLNRFRDRGICLEMCPTSNMEVVGYAMEGEEGAESYGRYPLRRYMEEGLAVALCTDNPGISRTDVVGEYLMAHRLCGERGLTLWEVLGLMKQSFASSFLPFDRKERLMKEVDRQIYDKVMTTFFSYI